MAVTLSYNTILAMHTDRLFGYEEDDKKAIHWFEKASEQGYAESKTLAEYLLEGDTSKKTQGEP